jgi:hypothetical protein
VHGSQPVRDDDFVGLSQVLDLGDVPGGASDDGSVIGCGLDVSLEDRFLLGVSQRVVLAGVPQETNRSVPAASFTPRFSSSAS